MENRLLIIPPSSLMGVVGKNATIIISSSAFDTIRDQLIRYGFKRNRIFLFNFAFMNLSYTDKSFIWDHISDFQRVYDRMGDDKSRRIYTNLLNYKITKDECYLQALKPDVDDEEFQYFDKNLFSFRSDDIFLDVGAYIGDTLESFIHVYLNGFRKYYAFEADEEIYIRLQNKVEQLKCKDKIEIFNLAAWDEDSILTFDKNPGSSKVKADNALLYSVKAKKIDDVIFSDERISIIKMDIEGAEYNALNGMKELIKRNKPILAICVYHLRDDYFRLTDFIEELIPGEYSYFFRQYRYTPTETVCFAIPQNRLLLNNKL